MGINHTVMETGPSA